MLQKRLDYGFNGYNVPFFPKATRSSRRRGMVHPEDDDQMSAFDLLATVAGELLQGESSKDACPGKDQSMNVENAENKEHDDVSLVTSSDFFEKDDVPSAMDIDKKIYKIPDLNEIVEQCDDYKSFSENEDPKISTRITPTVATSDSNGEIALFKDKLQNICGLVSSSMGDIKVRVFSRDDDENSSVCRQPSTISTVRPRSRIGDQRIRRLLASKHWSVAPIAKNRDFFDTESCSLYRRRKFGYKHRRSRRIYSFKNRRSFRYRSLPNSVVDISRKGVCDSSANVNDMTASGFGQVGHGVKLKIKSFRVPEFVIEMPKTATVGSLKRSVMEAVKTLLRDGLCIGVLVQGKKIKDDGITLLQSGICLGDKVGSLGFTLEPNSSCTNIPASSEDNSLVLDTDRTEPSSRCPTTSTCHQGVSHESSYNLTSNMGNFMESDHDSVPSHTEMSAEKGKDDSGALSTLPEGTPQVLSAVPATQKSTEIGQRRIRRPFSIAEVEALVQAVEELGTGRWRDVKQHAFDDVKHRTYVDLKDKWKTLVHTAKISPQQRRGQPVPQELLDRVLAAHEFWYQQQTKQQPKHQLDQACDLL